MSGIVDIVLPKRSVTLYGVEIEITGVKNKAIGELWDRFPQISDMAEAGKFGLKELLSLDEEVVAAFIAAGTGRPGDPIAEAFARELPLGDQAELIAAILERTLPRSSGPFVESWLQILTLLGMIRPAQKNAGAGAATGN